MPFFRNSNLGYSGGAAPAWSGASRLSFDYKMEWINELVNPRNLLAS